MLHHSACTLTDFLTDAPDELPVCNQIQYFGGPHFWQVEPKDVFACLFIFADVHSSENNIFFLCIMLVLLPQVTFYTLVVRAVTNQLLSHLPSSSWLFWSKSSISCVAMLIVSSVILNSKPLLQNTDGCVIH